MFSSTGYSPHSMMGPAFDAGDSTRRPRYQPPVQSRLRLRLAAEAGRTRGMRGAAPDYYSISEARAFYTARARRDGLEGHQNRHNRYRLLANPEG